MTLSRLRFAVAVEVFVVLLAAGTAQVQVQVPTDVLKTCKNEVGARYLNIPMAYISVDRGSKTANGNYLVNWTTKPPGGAGSVGLCVVDPAFNVLRFETASGPPPGSAEVNISAEGALRICKNQAADRLRIVPMENITLERGKDLADGSYVILWTEKAQGGLGRTGSCIIASDGKAREFRFDKPSTKPPGANPAH